MCQRLHAALSYSKSQQQQQQQQQTNVDDNNKSALAFVRFFATPIENLNDMVAAVLAQEEELPSLEDLATHVRLLQEYEILFWDACYQATEQ